MPLPTDTPPASVEHLQAKARLLIYVFLALVAGAIVFVLYARGAFDATQRLVLIAEDPKVYTWVWT